jgi:hypothetical protein
MDDESKQLLRESRNAIVGIRNILRASLTIALVGIFGYILIAAWPMIKYATIGNRQPAPQIR